jgi:hypothetical protein
MKAIPSFGISLIISGVLLFNPLAAQAAAGSCPKYEPLLRKHGLPVKVFSPIMWRESRCQPKAIGWNYKKGKTHKDCRLAPASIYRKCKAVRSYDIGLLQINSSWVTLTSQICNTRYGDMTVLLNANCNLKVAAALYDNGDGLSNWRATSGK